MHVLECDIIKLRIALNLGRHIVQENYKNASISYRNNRRNFMWINIFIYFALAMVFLASLINTVAMIHFAISSKVFFFFGPSLSNIIIWASIVFASELFTVIFFMIVKAYSNRKIAKYNCRNKRAMMIEVYKSFETICEEFNIKPIMLYLYANAFGFHKAFVMAAATYYKRSDKQIPEDMIFYDEIVSLKNDFENLLEIVNSDELNTVTTESLENLRWEIVHGKKKHFPVSFMFERHLKEFIGANLGRFGNCYDRFRIAFACVRVCLHNKTNPVNGVISIINTAGICYWTVVMHLLYFSNRLRLYILHNEFDDKKPMCQILKKVFVSLDTCEPMDSNTVNDLASTFGSHVGWQSITSGNPVKCARYCLKIIEREIGARLIVVQKVTRLCCKVITQIACDIFFVATEYHETKLKDLNKNTTCVIAGRRGHVWPIVKVGNWYAINNSGITTQDPEESVYAQSCILSTRI